MLGVALFVMGAGTTSATGFPDGVLYVCSGPTITSCKVNALVFRAVVTTALLGHSFSGVRAVLRGAGLPEGLNSRVEAHLRTKVVVFCGALALWQLAAWMALAPVPALAAGSCPGPGTGTGTSTPSGIPTTDTVQGPGPANLHTVGTGTGTGPGPCADSYLVWALFVCGHVSVCALNPLSALLAWVGVAMLALDALHSVWLGAVRAGSLVWGSSRARRARVAPSPLGNAHLAWGFLLIPELAAVCHMWKDVHEYPFVPLWVFAVQAVVVYLACMHAAG